MSHQRTYLAPPAYDVRLEIMDNCDFLITNKDTIRVITSKDPVSGLFRAYVTRADYWGDRVFLQSDACLSSDEAVKSLHMASCEAIHKHIREKGFSALSDAADMEEDSDRFTIASDHSCAVNVGSRSDNGSDFSDKTLQPSVSHIKTAAVEQRQRQQQQQQKISVAQTGYPTQIPIPYFKAARQGGPSNTTLAFGDNDKLHFTGTPDLIDSQQQGLTDPQRLYHPHSTPSCPSLAGCRVPHPLLNDPLDFGGVANPHSDHPPPPRYPPGSAPAAYARHQQEQEQERSGPLRSGGLCPPRSVPGPSQGPTSNPAPLIIRRPRPDGVIPLATMVVKIAVNWVNHGHNRISVSCQSTRESLLQTAIADTHKNVLVYNHEGAFDPTTVRYSARQAVVQHTQCGDRSYDINSLDPDQLSYLFHRAIHENVTPFFAIAVSDRDVKGKGKETADVSEEKEEEGDQ